MATVPDHFSVLRNYYSQLYKEKSMCDLSLLTVDGATVLAHKLIVAGFSGAVRTEVERWKDLPQVSMAVDCDQNVLHCILDFIYTGKFDCNTELLPLLNQACEGLDVPALRTFLYKTYESHQLEAPRRRDNIKVELPGSASGGSGAVKTAKSAIPTHIIKLEVEDSDIQTGAGSSAPAKDVKENASKTKKAVNEQVPGLPVKHTRGKAVKKGKYVQMSDQCTEKTQVTKNSGGCTEKTTAAEKSIDRCTEIVVEREKRTKSKGNSNRCRKVGKDREKSSERGLDTGSGKGKSQEKTSVTTKIKSNKKSIGKSCPNGEKNLSVNSVQTGSNNDKSFEISEKQQHSGKCVNKENDLKGDNLVEKTKRVTRNKTKSCMLYNDDFEWSEDNCEVSYDSDTQDEDYLPSNDTDNKTKTSFTNISRKRTRSSTGSRLCLKEPVIKLVRIDQHKNVDDSANRKRLRTNRSDQFLYHKSLVQQSKPKRYSKEYMTTLAQSQKAMKKKRKKFLAKYPRTFTSKIQHGPEGSDTKTLITKVADKIKKRLNEPFRDIQVNNTGYSCKVCKFWHTNMFQVRLHINKTHQARQDWPKRNKKRKKKTWNAKNKPAWVKRKMNRIQRKTEKLQCFICNKNLKTIRTLSCHYTDVHGWSAKKTQRLTGYPKYFAYNQDKGTCQQCGKQFTSLKDLRAHNRSVHKQKYTNPDIPCKVTSCSQKFINVTTLRAHLIKAHKMSITEAKANTRNIYQNGCLVSKVMSRVQKQEETIKRLMVKKENPRDDDLSMSRSLQKVQLNIESKTLTTMATGESSQKRKCKYSIITPKKKYVCNGCGIPTIFQNKFRLKTHSSVVHKRIMISRLFEGRVVAKKSRQKMFPLAGDFVVINSRSHKKKNVNPRSYNKCLNKNDLVRLGGSVEESTLSSHDVNNANYFFDESAIQGVDIVSNGCCKNTFAFQNEHITAPPNNGQSSYQETNNSTLVAPSHQEKKSRCKRQYRCQLCSKVFRFYSFLYGHWQLKHSSRFKQNAINKMVSKHVTLMKQLYIIPSRIVTRWPKGDNLRCEVCDKLFANLRNLATHLQSCHNYTFEQSREVTGYPTIVRAAYLPKSMAISCMNCTRTYSNLRSLSIHLQNNHKYTFDEAREATGYPSYKKDPRTIVKKIHHCDKCSEKFNLRKDLTKHMLEVHGVNCEVCGQQFATLISLKRHGMREHPQNVHLFQSLKTNNKSIWENSDEEEKKETDYKCEKCDFSTRKLNLLTAHVMETHPEVQYNCPVCGYSFRTMLSVEKHIEKHHGEGSKKKLKCIFCDKKFLRLQFLRVHQFKVHGIPHRSIKEYVCDTCQKVFHTQNEYNQHRRQVHLLPKIITCNQCNFTTNARHKLLQHVRHVHLGLKAALCESCGKSFTTEQHMRTHYRRYHTNDFFNLQCEYCAYRCGARNELQTHVWHNHQVRLEDDTRQYWQCDQCTYSTPLKNKFINHMNGHNNVRNFMCDQCDARFITSSTMREHIKWKHSSPDNVKICKECGYKTKTNSRLNEHIRVQHQLKGYKPYKCVYCDFRSATNGNCRKHIMGRHRDMPVKYEVEKEYLNAAKEARKDGNTICLVAGEQGEQFLSKFVPVKSQPDEIDQVDF